MEKFKIGDVVSLKSGGLSMTIEDISGESSENDKNATATCIWMDAENMVVREQFILAILQKHVLDYPKQADEEDPVGAL